MERRIISSHRRELLHRERGMALITTIMVMMLCSVLMVGFVTAIVSDQRAAGLDRDQTQAYAVAHAGLEQLTADLSTLFVTDFSPNQTQLNGLTTQPPGLPGFTYVAPDGSSGYRVAPRLGFDAQGNPRSDPNGTISAGPYQGFRGMITPYEITVTSRSQGNAEVRLRRELQTVAVPVFQFGFFSETDLAFHAGDNFTFGGRVHTNGNLYLSAATNWTLTLGDRVTAVNEIIRTHLPNGLDGTNGYNGTVSMIKAANTFRNLLRTEGSLVNTVGSAVNEPKWTQTSIGQYNSYIRNGRTGARRLDLPIVSDSDGNGQPDANPVELIRRPNPAVADPGTIAQERYFSRASLRILLSDDVADITNLPTVTAGAPVALTNGLGYAPGAPPATRPPLAVSPANPAAADGNLPANVYKSTNAPLIGGVIKIELQRQNGGWVDVTGEILDLGIAGRNLALNTGALAARWHNPSNVCLEPNPNAVIRLQRVRDVPFDATAVNNATNNATSCGYTLAGGNVSAVTQRGTDYWPLALYDAREGQMRDGMAAPAAGATNLALGGIIHYIELDVNNLRRWLAGAIGVSGPLARNDNGFIIYFSDRRNNNNLLNQESGEYGFEDVINPPNMTAVNAVRDAGEDLNANGVLDVYGGTPALVNYPNLATAPLNAASNPRHFSVLPTGGANPDPRLVARANRTLLFRRALKLVNGGNQNAVMPGVGLSIVAENPIYIQGNYNATVNLVANEAHVPCSVMADAVTLLSNNWSDLRSFATTQNSVDRPASTTAYRTAIITGKTIAFPRPNWADASFGSDGGAHNFIRQLEDWNNGNNPVSRYRGSFVSFFTSRQAVGSFKCCDGDAYVRGGRAWTFDADFLSPTLLPPGTPMFRDINTLTFRQLLRPTQ